jgi:DNA-directed RNA polymerase specialized sigma24 family protein
MPDVPPDEIADALVYCREARSREQAARDNVRFCRDDLAAAVLEASEAGHSYATIGDVIGLSKQRVGELIDRARATPAL